MFHILVASLRISVISPSPLPWTRTSHDGLLTLTVNSNASYSVVVSSVAWPRLWSPAPHGAQPSQAVATSGRDPALGAFDELLLPTANASAVAFRWFRDAEAFVFLRVSTPTAREVIDSAPVAFPNFWFDTYVLGNATRYVFHHYQ